MEGRSIEVGGGTRRNGQGKEGKLESTDRRRCNANRGIGKKRRGSGGRTAGREKLRNISHEDERKDTQRALAVVAQHRRRNDRKENISVRLD